MRLPQVVSLACMAAGAAARDDLHARFGAVMMPEGLIPRYMADRAMPLLKREGNCGSDRHPCLDIGHGEACCDDDSYCYVGLSGDAKCCPIGSDCPNDSKCSSEDYFCTRTVSASGTASVQSGCCDRSCPQTSQYLCPADLGGNCCQYGSECQSGGSCVSTIAPSVTAVVTPIVSGCTTAQFKCADGSGCCYNGMHCTEISGSGFCAEGPAPTSSETSSSDSGDGGEGLSDGAIAGIVVGVIVALSLIIGIVAWMFLRKRKQKRKEQAANSQDGSGVHTEQDGSMTEATGGSNQAAATGLTRHYYGPDAVAGPYTEQDAALRTSPTVHRAVPSEPHAPGDITTPAEIDSKSGPLTPESSVSAFPGSVSNDQNIRSRFELPGSMPPEMDSSENVRM